MTPDPSASSSPVSSLAVRDQLVEALELDLVGPPPGHALAHERLRERDRPSTWYLTGFLTPAGTPAKSTNDSAADDVDDDGEPDTIPEKEGLVEESAEERKAAKRSFFPSSMGLSFLIAGACRELRVRVCWGDYALNEVTEANGEKVLVWQRTPQQRDVAVPLTGSTELRRHVVPDSGGLQINVVERSIDAQRLRDQVPKGTRSVSIFLVNNRERIEPGAGPPEPRYVFQPVLEVECATPFVPRPNPRGCAASDWDDQVADLHYGDTPEYATGHGVSADWDLVGDSCRCLRTKWIPRAQVEKTKTAPIPDVELRMDPLGALADGAAAVAALSPLVTHYRTWIDEQRKAAEQLTGQNRKTALGLVENAGTAATRIQAGIEALREDADALDAFRVANRAVAAALRARNAEAEPSWRAFQLAFLLLNLPGLADPKDPNRATVDLLFFPTGGGKTEAYLGLAAFAMVMRRLRNPQHEGRAGAGVAVIMRYTLRLLTLDQLGRAAGLVCALELERRKNPNRYGVWPFEIGLWVGKAATPNRMGRKGDGSDDTARIKVLRYIAHPKSNPIPVPIEECPWCRRIFEPRSFELVPDADSPKALQISCANLACPFSTDSGLPIVAVDEPLYRRLPAFVIATVDKFASLPWNGSSGMLLGGAERFDANGFVGPTGSATGTRLDRSLPPPDLIIQDELHLISGPLGTIAGLYETVIEGLCLRGSDTNTPRPKIVASTATVRHAQDQIQALFGRSSTRIFPPPGPDRRDSFFAQTIPAEKTPARLYVGLAAPGRNPKVLFRRAWVAVMGATQRAYEQAGGKKNPNNPADPYTSVLGYFNALRELGGARRILEEEVQATLKSFGSRKRYGETEGLFRDRLKFTEVLELTSRVSTAKVAEARRKLGCSIASDEHVDCAIATNMISVGLDIPRLGLMVVLGQPKTHSEYIQATSRVGREDAKPGLVLTLLNVHKPRDRSHYERFRHYHETFYRSVEASSVTPFSARALDRGLAGALVAYSRHVLREMTPSSAADRIATHRADLDQRLQRVFLDRVREQPGMTNEERAEVLRSVQERLGHLLDAWVRVVDGYQSNGVATRYQRYEDQSLAKPLLREMLDREFESLDHRQFRVNRSMRDVEPSVNVFVQTLSAMNQARNT